MTLSLFDKPETAAPAPDPIAARVEDPRPRFGPNVARAIAHHRGVFRRVRDGNVVDEFYLLELRNGSIVEQTTSGHMRQADLARGGVERAREIIASSLASGIWQEVH